MTPSYMYYPQALFKHDKRKCQWVPYILFRNEIRDPYPLTTYY